MSRIILTDSAPSLRQPSEPVTSFDDSLSATVDEMRQIMLQNRGLGLAAPQIGLNQQIVVIEYQAEDSRESIPFLALINPRLTWTSVDQVTQLEGCLSLPGLEGEVRRSRRCRVKAFDVNGQKIEMRAGGLLARVLQHEIDHLSGILYSDRMAKGTKPHQVTETN